jgi:hypothetical protein
LARFFSEAHDEIGYMADRLSTFFLSNEDKKTTIIQPEVEKGGK